MKKFIRNNFSGFFYFLAYAKYKFKVLNYKYKFFRQLESLLKEKIVLKKSNKKILFFSARQDKSQLVFNKIIDLALQVRGHKTLTIGCDGDIRKACTMGSSPKIDYFACKECKEFSAKTHSLSKSNIHWLSELYSNDDLIESNKIINQFDDKDLPNVFHKGFHIGEFVRVSINHFLKVNLIVLEDKNTIRIYRDFLKASVRQINSFSRFLDEHKPDRVFMLSGLLAAERIMLEVARSKNIHVITYELGYSPQTFFLWHNKPINMCCNDFWDEFKGKKLSKIENKQLDQYIEQRYKGGGMIINYFPKMQTDISKIAKKYHIDFSKKTFLLFPNLTWDSTLYNIDLFFKSHSNWIIETIEYFINKPNDQLIVRCHPSESILDNANRDKVQDIIDRNFTSLPKNIIIIPSDSGVSSYLLMNNSICGLFYGSTTAIEMGVKGTPTVIAGNIFYRKLGVSIDPNEKSEYFSIINKIATGTYDFNKEEFKEIWRRYAYYAIFRSGIPIDFLNYPNVFSDPYFNLNKLDDLSPGNNLNLDIICNGILNKTRFLIDN